MGTITLWGDLVLQMLTVDHTLKCQLFPSDVRIFRTTEKDMSYSEMSITSQRS